MAAREHVSEVLETLVRRRKEVAYELAHASESERATQEYLDQEELMNLLTVEIERLRRDSSCRNGPQRHVPAGACV